MKKVTLTTSLLALGFAACGGGVGDESSPDLVADTSEPIIGGTVSPAGQAEAMGWVRVNRLTSMCSGTLVQNDLVLTARHCTTTDGQINGPADNNMANYTLNMGPAANNRGVTEVLRHGTLDVAIMQLGNFLATGTAQSRFDFRRTIYSGTNASLNGSSPLCYGYGNTAITRCTPPPVAGTGAGTLNQGNINITSADTTFLTFTPTGTTSTIQWTGDSGSSCLRSGEILGVLSTVSCRQTPLSATSTRHVGPEAYRVWANGIINGRGRMNIQVASASNISGHITTINDTLLNNEPNAFFHVTANWNPGGNGGTYNTANTGIWYNSSAARWTIFNQGFTAMPVNAAFNWWKVAAAWWGRHTASASNILANLPHVTRVDLGSAGNNSNPNLMLIVTQLWDGVYNDHPVGVWFDPVSARWYIYNEDLAPMPAGAKFNVSVVTNTWGGFIHTSNAATVSGNSTFLDHQNINAQPNAQFVVTHNFRLGGGSSGTYHAHPVGVWYDTSRQRWAVFNQDFAAMPTGVTFNVMVRP